MRETNFKALKNLGHGSNKPRKRDVRNMKPVNRSARRAIATTKGKKNENTS